jgi:hypothetical protein
MQFGLCDLIDMRGCGQCVNGHDLAF